jgi:phage baseplate assembly protein W
VPKDFLGRGWKFPLILDEVGRVVLSEFEQDIRESIRIILLTARGERVMRPDFGSGLHEHVFSTMSTADTSSIQTAVQQALIKWEPRIQLLSVKVNPGLGQAGQLLVEIDYRVRATNTRFNLVFPFFLKERL